MSSHIIRTAHGYRFGDTVIEGGNLSHRESQLALLTCGEGYDYKQAGKELGISASTASNIAQRIFCRLNVHNLLQASIALHKSNVIKHLLLCYLIAAIQFSSDDIYRRPQRTRPPGSVSTARLSRRNEKNFLELNELLQPQ